MNNHNNIGPRDGWDGQNTEPANGEASDRQLDIPVKSWEAYRDWCKRVRDSWQDDQGDKPPQLFG